MQMKFLAVSTESSNALVIHALFLSLNLYQVSTTDRQCDRYREDTEIRSQHHGSYRCYEMYPPWGYVFHCVWILLYYQHRLTPNKQLLDIFFWKKWKNELFLFIFILSCLCHNKIQITEKLSERNWPKSWSHLVFPFPHRLGFSVI